MPNTHHVTEFAGLPVVEFSSWEAIRGDFERAMHSARNQRRRREEYPSSYRRLFDAIAAPGSVAWRLKMEPPPFHLGPRHGQKKPFETLTEYLERFTDLVDRKRVHALIVGNIPDDDYQMRAEEAASALVGFAPKLTGLRSLFFGEILREENEISWINLCDLAPLVSALPRLEELVVRGGTGDLGLRVPEHRSLRSLTVQSGALRPDVVRDVCASGLPALEHLELWLGAEDYGGDTTPQDLAPLLSGRAFPELRSLGLRNAEYAGTWVRALAESPVLPGLDTLDLSLGILCDKDAKPLLEAPAFRGLRRLDLHHHFLSEDMRERVREALPGVEVDLSDPQEPDVYGDRVYYYTAVSE
ncbi:hypothetical protein A6A08_20790 [Nocardiopsis sp. TSRI0078]|uniref:STM4015 family protein n=1 Tax=unclassified Nocardiopsis TaxID=2649073 RepID=UPI00093FCC5E|nr:STM4015 family protein [Nocardiopsis sp. TSRI0078]OKI22016.1 hypothetical protein A6A08_20790 [Nocardiopsis sp. TSRI0078]